MVNQIEGNGAPIGDFVPREIKGELMKMGRVGDVCRLYACSPQDAKDLLGMRGDPDFGGTPRGERPIFDGHSRRVASQKYANSRR